MNKRKGQFFIIGTTIIIGLLLGTAILRGGVSVTTTDDSVTRNTFERSIEELPHSATIALERNHTSESVERLVHSFIRYKTFLEAQQGISSQTYFLVGIPTENGYNTTFGNFRGETLENVWIRLGNQATRIDTLPDQETTTVELANTDNSFQVELNFSTRKHSFQSSRKTFSLFHYRLDSGNNIWQDTAIN